MPAIVFVKIAAGYKESGENSLGGNAWKA